ncbi:AGAP005162-PB-like protein [Anopheles sinensis]|uniref:AGAP005162-PB-like protein n=1 Tax=Anopheles sinensis TaxID=74873 RepID=A0A084W2E1_ANOSI|nr:AGAP005162-PB-like protein [Anopheles sinensis]
MNLRYQETFCIIFILCTSITLGEDFDFVPETNDDVEVTGRCLPTESTIKLSLGLKSKNWKHVQASLKQRTITKLAEYFLVPEVS